MAFLGEELDRTARELRHLRTRSSNVASINGSWGTFLFFVMIGLLLFVLPHFAAVSLGTLTGYALTMLYIQQPLDTLLNGTPLIAQGEIALQQMEKTGLARAGTEEDAPQPRPARPDGFSLLELVDVTHTYRHEREDKPFTLGPLRLSLRRGELVFLVGGNGSGKTTLAKLITGLYAPESGEIRLDGQAVGPARSRTVPAALLHGVLRLLPLRPAAGPGPGEPGRAHAGYLEQLQLNHKVRVEGGTLSTTQLSQGQRKRLALLVAYLEDRPLYVFDEWAADQDPDFKASSTRSCCRT